MTRTSPFHETFPVSVFTSHPGKGNDFARFELRLRADRLRDV
jgi:hypothetical protein